MSRSCIETVWQFNLNSDLYFYSCPNYFFAACTLNVFLPFCLSVCLCFSLCLCLSLTYIVVLFYRMPVEIVRAWVYFYALQKY